jgi:hypothetical protein
MITNAGATWAIIAVVVVCLASWLILVRFADDHPRYKMTRKPRMTGPVLGGMHLAEGGRSVAPNRDAPAEFTEAEARAMSHFAEPGLPVPTQRTPTTRPSIPSQPLPLRQPSGTRQPRGASQPPGPPGPRLPDPRDATHDEPAKHQQP